MIFKSWNTSKLVKKQVRDSLVSSIWALSKNIRIIIYQWWDYITCKFQEKNGVDKVWHITTCHDTSTFHAIISQLVKYDF